MVMGMAKWFASDRRHFTFKPTAFMKTLSSSVSITQPRDF